MNKIGIQKLIFLCALQAFCLYGIAQQVTKTIKNAVIKTDSNNLIVEVVTPGKSIAEVLQNKEDFLKCATNVSFQPVRSQKDLIGNEHFYYQQYINNIPVLYGELALHTKTGGTYLITGNYVNKNEEKAPQKLPIPVSKIFSASEKVKSLYGNRITTAPESKLEYKIPTLMFAYLKEDDRNDFLNYSSYIVVDIELKSWESYRIVLEYEDLRVIKIIPLFQSGCAIKPQLNSKAGVQKYIPGIINSTSAIPNDCANMATLNTLFNGSYQRNTTTNGVGGFFILNNTCNPTPFLIRNLNRDTNYTNITHYADANNTWVPDEGTQTFWGIGQTLDYYKTKFNRPGMINNNSQINAYSNVAYTDGKGSFSGDNATHYSNHKMFFGYGYDLADATDDVVHLDVTSHEFTHGVTQETTNMAYYSQAGAINESLSDIFAKCTDAFNNAGSVSSWLLRASPTWTIRSLSNPPTYGHPKYYKGENWLNTDTCSGQPAYDNCGVHINSGVMNYWFYRMVTGATFTDPNGVTVSFGTMPIATAEKIVYQALNYFGNNPNYFAARNATIQAARDLYGNCSQEAIHVGKAWVVAGVGQLSGAYDRIQCGIQSSGSISAIRNLTLGEFLFCPGVTIPSGITFNAMAGKAVILRPTFVAQTGSYFNASIGLSDACMYQELN